ncbi:CHASE domain-containing protein [Gilvimarinus polysaccharolyticus]|uniref:CHASE domain-containing protein n=1 Tax=Gilvimarinus polysaccharolyticus TaxID=863921 RepID=UPI0006738808|nr:CHASE domain-containing protein [Gilvimarinus polysaccharolyticus]
MNNDSDSLTQPNKTYSYKRLLFSRRGIPALLSFLLGLFFTGLATFSLYKQNQTNAQNQFNIHVEQILSSIDKRLQDHELILLGAAGLMKVQQNVSRQQWHDYVQGLLLTQRYPGIQGVGYAEIFPASELAVHEKSIQAEGFTDYAIKPKGERETYSGIKYLEPFSGRNLAAFGYDMYSNPIRRDAMRRATEENTTAISGKVKLVQETHGKEQAGFLMYVPIYTKKSALNTAKQRWQAIEGYVYSPYRMDDLMAGIFNREHMLIDFQVFDGEPNDDETLMYESGLANNNQKYNPFIAQRQLATYGRNWTINVIAQDGFQAQFDGPQKWLVPILGGGISFSIFIMMLVLTGRRESAQHLANRMIEQYTHAQEHFDQQLSDVFSAASEVAIIATDTQGTITLFNSGAERLLGYKACELVGNATPAILHVPAEMDARSEELSAQLGEPISGFDVFITVPVREGSESREWHYVTSKGQKIAVSLTTTVIRNDSNEITGFLGIAQDISERKRMEKMKNEFISTVSHELRTPLTSVSGALGLVLGGHMGEIPDKAEKILTTAHRNSKRLALLINDLLDIEKISAGELHFDMQLQPIDPILEQALEENITYGVERRVSITLTNKLPNAQVQVDGLRLKQVMANLLSNAIKFSPDGGSVTIEAQADEEHLIVSVSDQGCGIPENFQHKIFQKFAQADSSDTRKKGGTGLGLAISRELIERMKGSIGFESTEGKGCRFFFQLPLVKTAGPNSEKETPKTDALDNTTHRILIVEDDADVASLLKIMLEDAGYQADICHRGAEALEALKARHYDLISLDLMLPDISGIDIIRHVKEQADTADIPIVVISARMGQGRLELNSETDNIEWLAKPVDHERLINMVKRHLPGHEHPKILHIEDDADFHAAIRTIATDHMALDLAPTLEDARSLLTQHSYDAVLLDIGLPDGEGWDLIPTIKSEQPDAIIIVLTDTDVSGNAHHDVEAVLMKTRITTKQLIDLIHNRLNSHPKRISRPPE